MIREPTISTSTFLGERCISMDNYPKLSMTLKLDDLIRQEILEIVPETIKVLPKNNDIYTNIIYRHVNTGIYLLYSLEKVAGVFRESLRASTPLILYSNDNYDNDPPFDKLKQILKSRGVIDKIL